MIRTHRLATLFALAGSFLAAASGCTTRDDITAELLRSTDDVGVPITTVAENELEVALGKLKMQRNFQTYSEVGLAYLHRKDNANALDAFRHAVEIAPTSAVGLNNLCVAYNELGRWDEGIAACEKALQAQPDFHMAKNNLAWGREGPRRAKAPADASIVKLDQGMVFYTAKDYRKAIEVWKGIGPDSAVYANAQSNIASAAILSRDWKTAKKSIANALEREPANEHFRANRAWLESTMPRTGQ